MLLTNRRQSEINAEPISIDINETDRVGVLREILEDQQQREICYEEAREVGDALIEFYQTLAEELCDESTS